MALDNIRKIPLRLAKALPMFKKLFFFAFIAGMFLLLGIFAINIYMIQFSKPYIFADFSQNPPIFFVKNAGNVV